MLRLQPPRSVSGFCRYGSAVVVMPVPRSGARIIGALALVDDDFDIAVLNVAMSV
jgi:hypothetical protein